MRNTKSWMIAGAVAGLLVAHGSLAAEDPESTPGTTASPSDPAPSAGEGARPETAAPATPGTDQTYGTGSGFAGAGAGDPMSPSDAGNDAARASAAERAAQFDASQVAAGNTGGRG
jgi:hypothetical protein